MRTSELTLLWEVFSSIEYEFRDLPSLHPSAIGTIWGALKLDSHLATLNFRHAFLSKVAEFISIQYHAGCVEGVWFNLHWVLKPHGESIAGAIWEVLAQVLPQNNALPLEFNLGAILCRTTAGAIQPKASNEHSLINCELDAAHSGPDNATGCYDRHMIGNGDSAGGRGPCGLYLQTATRAFWLQCTRGKCHWSHWELKLLTGQHHLQNHPGPLWVCGLSKVPFEGPCVYFQCSKLDLVAGIPLQPSWELPQKPQFLWHSEFPCGGYFLESGSRYRRIPQTWELTQPGHRSPPSNAGSGLAPQTGSSGRGVHRRSWRW